MSFQNSKTLRVYTNRGQERFVRAGQIVPKGWFGPNMEVLEEDHVAILQETGGDPYEMIQRSSFSVYLKKL